VFELFYTKRTSLQIKIFSSGFKMACHIALKNLASVALHGMGVTSGMAGANVGS
jgi:hypothetical protein